jgi:hypothetical protein
MEKIIRDPVYDIIEIEEKALALLNTKAMQRLRRIKQLGVAWMVYPAAEHSRFTHSLGVYHIAKKMLASFKNHGHEIVNSENIVLAALLHDVGHIAFSHAFEGIIRKGGGAFKHEDLSIKIIEEDLEIKSIISPSEIEAICSILRKEFLDNVAVAVISSQLDADRLDYLLRDSYMTGANYGNVDLEWLIKNLWIVDSPSYGRVIAIDIDKGLNVLEQYILARFYMYRHVYYHKVIKGFEGIVEKIFKRFQQVGNKNCMGFDAFDNLIAGTSTLTELMFIDDYFVVECFKDWYNKLSDKILRILIEHFLYRKPFKRYSTTDIKEYKEKNIKFQEIIKEKYGSDAVDYFLFEDTSAISAFNFNIKDISQDIYVYSKGTNEVKRLDDIGDRTIINSDTKGLSFSETRLFVPKEIWEELRRRE